MNVISLILTFLTWILTWISKQIVVILTGLVAFFTGLYWWNARRAFLLELDRVLLWVRLEEEKTTEKMLDKTIDINVKKSVDQKMDKMMEKILAKHTLTPEQRKEGKSYVRESESVRRAREKMLEGIHENVRGKIQEEIEMDKIAGDEAFLNTLKSKKLAARMRKWKEEKQLLLKAKKRGREGQADNK